MKKSKVLCLAMVLAALMISDVSDSQPVCRPGETPVMTRREGNNQYFKCVPKEVADEMAAIDSCLQSSAKKAPNFTERDGLIGECLKQKGMCQNANVEQKKNVEQATGLRLHVKEVLGIISETEKQMAQVEREMQENDRMREEWQKMIDDAVADSYRNAFTLIPDITKQIHTRWAPKAENARKTIASHEREIQDIKKLKNPRPSDLEDLKKLEAENASLKPLVTNVDNLGKFNDLWFKKGGEVFIKGVEVGKKMAEQKKLEAAAETAYMALTKFVEANPGLVKNLGGVEAAEYMRLTKSIFDSTINIGTELIAMPQISNVNRDKWKLQDRMKYLKGRMDKLGKDLDNAETDLKNNFRCKSAL
jgi:hypothetical protein